MSNVIYFIATNYTLDVSVFERHHNELYAGDILFFGRMPHLELFYDHPRILTFHNIWMDTLHWRGVEFEPIYRRYNIKGKYVFWDVSIANHELFIKHLNDWKTVGGSYIDISKCDLQYPYDKQPYDIHAPSAGYICYKYFKNFYEKIGLVGFTFQGSKRHNWAFEREVITADPNVFILT